MLRLDLVYCISFSICHHAGLRLIVWRFLLVKAFKHPDSGCVSCTAYRVCSKSEMRWLSSSCCFHGHTDKAFALTAPNWPREDISPVICFDNYRSSYCGPLLIGNQWGSGRKWRGQSPRGPLVVQAGGWREPVLCFLWALSNILWWQGPFLNSKSWAIFGQK